jgi:hypothetical protein
VSEAVVLLLLLLLLRCRLDAARPGFGEMSLLSNLTATLGQKVWKQTLVVLTHANGGESMQQHRTAGLESGYGEWGWTGMCLDLTDAGGDHTRKRR